MRGLRTIIFSILLAALSAPRAAAQDEVIVFDSKTWDFGEMSDREGAVTHVYRFRNVSPSPVRVGSASVSCGCIELEYPGELITPGGTGDVVMSFFPAGTGGEVVRTADLYDGRGRHLATLTMTAYVEREESDLEDVFHAVLSDGFASDRTELPFGYVYHGSTQKKLLRIANLSDRGISLNVVSEEPSDMLVIRCPKTVEARSEALVELEYTVPSDESSYGVAEDRLLFFIDGRPARKTVKVSCIYLAELSKEGPLPSLRTWPSLAGLRKSFFRDLYSGSMNIENAGKAPLRILGIVTDADVNLRKGDVIAPGAKFVLEASSYKDAFTVRLFTNDPVRPYKELIFKH